MRRCSFLVPLLLTSLASGCNKVTPTPVGTSVISWDVDKPRKDELAKAKIGERSKKKFVVLMRPPGDAPAVEFALDIEVAPFDVVTRTEAHYLKTPASVAVEVTKNERWVATGKCDAEGVAMPTAPPPAPLTLSCSLALTGAKQEAYGTFLVIKGDGTVDFNGNYDTTVLISAK
jgi:hypothetical protein